MILDLVDENDPILSQIIDESKISPELSDISNNMIETMTTRQGLGLSANQVGLNIRMFVMIRHTSDVLVCVNPKIKRQSNEMKISKEGCLSFPGLSVLIKRPEMIVLQFQTVEGEDKEIVLANIDARVALHEVDHLNGIKFYSRANLYHKEKAFKNRS